MFKVHFTRELFNFEDSGRLEAPGNSISGTGAHPESLSATRSPSFHSENWIFPFKKKKWRRWEEASVNHFSPYDVVLAVIFPRYWFSRKERVVFSLFFRWKYWHCGAKVQPSREPPGAPVPVSGRGHETRVPRPRKQVNYWTWSLNKVKV